MEDLRGYIINSLMVGLIIVLVVTFSIKLGGRYDKNANDMTGAYIDSSALENQINRTANDALTWQKVFQSDNMLVVLGGLVIYSIWGIVKLIFTTVVTFFQLFINLFTFIGIPPIVSGTILAILIISLIFMGWRLVKQGQ